MKKQLLGAGAVASTALALALAGLGPAAAAVIGSATIAPTTGDQDTNIVLQTSGLCPTGATSLRVLITGGDPATPSSQVSGGIIVGVSSLSAFSKSNGGYVIPFTLTFKDFAQANGLTPIKGDYVATAQCLNGFSAVGDFTATTRWLKGAGAFDGTYAFVAPAASPTPTATVTATASPTASPTAAATASPTASPSSSATPSPTATTSPTASPTAAASATSSPAPTPTVTGGSTSAQPAGSPETSGLGGGGTSLPTTGSSAAELLRWALLALLAGLLLQGLVAPLLKPPGRHARSRRTP